MRALKAIYISLYSAELMILSGFAALLVSIYRTEGGIVIFDIPYRGVGGVMQLMLTVLAFTSPLIIAAALLHIIYRIKKKHIGTVSDIFRIKESFE